MKWSNLDYFEKPKEFFTFQEFLEAAFPRTDSEMIEGLGEDLQMMAEDFSLEKTVGEFERRDLRFMQQAQLMQMLGLLNDLHNHTRIQANRGHTPAELFEEEKRHLFPLSGKIGRNDPYHCGSGKKYKKCCDEQPTD